MTAPEHTEDSRSERLASLAKSLPDSPGVYLMKDSAETVIYVGKAGSLRSRVGSYFVPSVDLGPKKQPMLDLIEDIEGHARSPVQASS